MKDMKLPYPKFMDVTPIAVSLTKGMNGNGAPNEVATWSGKCRYIDKAKTVLDPNGKQIRLEGKVTIGCDIAPTVELLEGSVTVYGKKMKIYKGSRPRNPDGTVHHTVLELM